MDLKIIKANASKKHGPGLDKLSSRRGHSSISLVFVMTLILALIILPIVSLIYEKYYISFLTRSIVDASYASISSVFDGVNVNLSSSEKIIYSSEGDLENKFKEFLAYNLNLNDPDDEDRSMDIEVIEFLILEKGQVDEVSGQKMNRQSIHIVIRLESSAFFIMYYRPDKVSLDIHFDYEVPIDN